MPRPLIRLSGPLAFLEFHVAAVLDMGGDLERQRLLPGRKRRDPLRRTDCRRWCRRRFSLVQALDFDFERRHARDQHRHHRDQH